MYFLIIFFLYNFLNNNLYNFLCPQEANASVSRGKITQYIVRVCSQHSGMDRWMNFSADLRSCLVPFCTDCEVTVWSQNSKGASPPARVSTRYRKGTHVRSSLRHHLSACRKTNYFWLFLSHSGKYVCVCVWFTRSHSYPLAQQINRLRLRSKLWVSTVSPSPGENLKLRGSRQVS